MNKSASSKASQELKRTTSARGLIREYIKLASLASLDRPPAILFAKLFLSASLLRPTKKEENPSTPNDIYETIELIFNEELDKYTPIANQPDRISIKEVFLAHLSQLKAIRPKELIPTNISSSHSNVRINLEPGELGPTKYLPASIRFYCENVSAPSIYWCTGEDNSGWAYANNALRISSLLHRFTHLFVNENGYLPEISFYFDLKLYLKSNSKGKINIVRVGGPNPLNSLYGKN